MHRDWHRKKFHFRSSHFISAALQSYFLIPLIIGCVCCIHRMIEIPVTAVKETDGGVGGGETDGKTSNILFFSLWAARWRKKPERRALA